MRGELERAQGKGGRSGADLDEPMAAAAAPAGSPGGGRRGGRWNAAKGRTGGGVRNEQSSGPRDDSALLPFGFGFRFRFALEESEDWDVGPASSRGLVSSSAQLPAGRRPH